MAGAHSKKEYIVIFFVLTFLTGVEVEVAKYTAGNTKLLGLISLALAKAALVALFYMHLKSEKRALKLVVGIPMIFPAIYAVVLIIESIARSAFT